MSGLCRVELKKFDQTTISTFEKVMKYGAENDEVVCNSYYEIAHCITQIAYNKRDQDSDKLAALTLAKNKWELYISKSAVCNNKVKLENARIWIKNLALTENQFEKNSKK
jgi:hypothetical protein